MQVFSQRFSIDDNVVDVSSVSSGGMCIAIEFETPNDVYSLNDNEIHEFITLGILPDHVSIPKGAADEIYKYISWVKGHLQQYQ